MPRVGQLRPAVLPAADSHWVPTRTGVVIDGRREKIDARVYGSVGVYPAVDGSGRWSVYLIPCDRWVLCVGSEADAFRVGEVLMRHCVLAIRKTTNEDVRAALPPWIEPWFRAMKAAGTFLDPDAYRLGITK